MRPRGDFRIQRSASHPPINAPAIVPGVAFSDHRNYWKHDWPALMVTDTAFLRNKEYHQAGDTGARQFVVLDAGMTELMRPALYGAFHRIDPVDPRAGEPVVADVVGPVCESTDTFARDRELPHVEVGDLMMVRDVGAYGAVMASTYLRRPLAPEVLVDDGQWRVIRRRQTLDDMLALEE